MKPLRRKNLRLYNHNRNPHLHHQQHQIPIQRGHPIGLHHQKRLTPAQHTTTPDLTGFENLSGLHRKHRHTITLQYTPSTHTRLKTCKPMPLLIPCSKKNLQGAGRPWRLYVAYSVLKKRERENAHQRVSQQAQSSPTASWSHASSSWMFCRGDQVYHR